MAAIRFASSSSVTSCFGWRCRLLCSAILIATLFLPQPFYRAALLIQILFYGLSVAAVAGLNIGPLSRVGDAARTFVVLNTAAMVAFVNFVTGKKDTLVRTFVICRSASGVSGTSQHTERGSSGQRK